MKRLFDVVTSAIALVVFSPLLVVIAIWVKLDSPGPIFYRGLRAGHGNSPFWIFKFRTMVSRAEQIGGSSTDENDPRITRPGRFIRTHKLDEIPQLMNVLLGDMSIVGPRPQILSYTSMYSGEYVDILSIRPGITDWASIWNSNEGAVLAGSPDPDRAYDILINPTKLRLQLRYVRTRSFWMDMRIVFCTLRRILDPGYYPKEITDVQPLLPGAGASIGRE